MSVHLRMSQCGRRPSYCNSGTKIRCRRYGDVDMACFLKHTHRVGARMRCRVLTAVLTASAAQLTIYHGRSTSWSWVLHVRRASALKFVLQPRSCWSSARGNVCKYVPDRTCELSVWLKIGKLLARAGLGSGSGELKGKMKRPSPHGLSDNHISSSTRCQVRSTTNVNSKNA